MADVDVQKFVLDLLEETRLYEDNKKVCEEIVIKVVLIYRNETFKQRTIWGPYKSELFCPL